MTFSGESMLEPVAPARGNYSTGGRPSSSQEGGRSRVFGSIALDAAGAGTAIISQPIPGLAYLIERITIMGIAVGTVNVYAGPAGDANLADYTTVLPNVSDEASPVYVAQGQPITVEITGGPALGTAKITLQLRATV